MRTKRTICKKQHDWLRMLGLTLLAVVLYAMQAQADTTQTWTITASCLPIEPCFDAANLSATLTTQMEQGTFYDAFTNSTFEGTEPVITSMAGTFDGQQVTLVPVASLACVR